MDMRKLFNCTGAGLPAAKSSHERAELASQVRANTDFALDLYEQLRDTPGNLIYSPYSISVGMAMAYAGAQGETALQIKKALRFPDGDTQMHQLFRRLDELLENAQIRGDIELSMANSLWPQKHYKLRHEFLDLLRTHYRTSITPVDFAENPEKARATINQWVTDRTRYKIYNLIGPGTLTTLTRMVLVNAIYFKGVWQSPFDESFTCPDRFYKNGSRTITVPFMHQVDHFRYGENDQLQLLGLPYAKGELEMMILLPRQHDGLGQLESNFSQTSLAETIAQAKLQEVTVVLPKFKLSTAFRLEQALQALGVKDAFDPERANFSGMDGNPHWLYISAAMHQAFIEVNEEGTEAAAASAMTDTIWGVTKKPMPPEFSADHPFLFVIREPVTGLILFMGRVVEPQAELPL